MAYTYIKNTGVIVPDVETIKNNVFEEYRTIFGENINLDASTPQGALAAAEIESRINIARNNATLANQINPNLSGGVFLDAILALTGSKRKAAIFTSVPVILAGQSGTVIPANSRVRSEINQEEFNITQDVTLNVSGQATTTVVAINSGPIDVAPNTITQIVPGFGVIGWETVNNTSAGTPGQLQQSDASARFERSITLALQGQSLPETIVSGVSAINGVNGKPKFLENVSDQELIIENVTMAPHSIYLCVDGGTDLAVATEILEKKSGGCNYNNGAGIPVAINVLESASEQNYLVKFDRPELIPVLVRVTISAATVSQEPEEQIINAILDYAAGKIKGETGLIIGADVSPFELAGAINCQQPEIFVKKLEVSLLSPINYSTNEIFIEAFQKATIAAGSITVVAG